MVGMEELVTLMSRLENLRDFTENNEKLTRLCEIHDFLEKTIEKFESVDKLVRMLEIVNDNPYVFKELLTARETAQLLGITDRHLRLLVSDLSIPHMKPTNKMLFFTQSEILEWMRQFRVLTKPELEEEAKRHMKKLSERSRTK